MVEGLLRALDERPTTNTCCAVRDMLRGKAKSEKKIQLGSTVGFCPRVRVAATRKADTGFCRPENSRIRLYEKPDFGGSWILMFFQVKNPVLEEVMALRVGIWRNIGVSRSKQQKSATKVLEKKSLRKAVTVGAIGAV